MSNNPLSNISYTNKDFTSIYVELLDLVKKLTYRWDPSISNESDPGNILLKLNAIIGDKNNYNTDKNVLENFPETLTQDISARSLYKQLAYRMPWYKAATTNVTFKWVGKEANELTDTSPLVTIPKFQMVTDSKSEFVYTTLSDITFSKWQLSQDVPVIEGIISNISVNGSEVIELNNLDYNNRLYFNDNNVAENGIFIYNVNDSSNNYWTMVDNLQVEELNKKCFEFGIDSRRNLCYVEFPQDIHNLIGNGLVVKYIVTNGYDGNIIARTLDRFYSEVTVPVNGEDVLINSDVVQLSNGSGTNNGCNPEDIDTAYRHYRKTAGTFHTLVTLRDYVNAIYNSGLVSNVIVCDRLNDVQSSYSIVTDSSVSNGKVNKVSTIDGDDYIGFVKTSSIYKTCPSFDSEKFYMPSHNGASRIISLSTSYADEIEFENDWQNSYFRVNDRMDDLGAFDLRMYILHSSGVVNTLNDYMDTFKLEPSNSLVEQTVKGYISNEKCVQHDFKDILKDIPCLFKNSFPLQIRIIPHYVLGNEQISDMKININKALFKLLNSSQLEFGQEPDYDVIYDTIFNADERIKVLILDNFKFTTFATYWDGKEFKDIPVSDFNSGNIIKVNNLQEAIAYKDKLNDYLYKQMYFVNTVNNDIYRYNNEDATITEYSNLVNDFRKDIIAKSILAGVTPLYKQDSLFKYSIDQKKLELKDTDRLSTYLKIAPHGNIDTPEVGGTNKINYKLAQYTLAKNENLTLLAPSFVTKTTYSNYVKFELILKAGENVKVQETHLSYDEYINNINDYLLTPITYDSETLQTHIDVSYDDYMSTLQNEHNGGDYSRRYVDVYENGKKLHTNVIIGNLMKDTSFVTKWQNGTYAVQFYMVCSDLSAEQIENWVKGRANIIIDKAVYYIPANTDYELQENEFITFFYKTEDVDDAPYTYRKYGKGTIIKPSFVTQGVTQDNAKINVNNLAETGTIPYSELSTSSYQKIYTSYNYNDLSGSKTIAIRAMNEVNLKTGEHYYYFITNNIDRVKNKYKLQPDANNNYILENDEYFIYTNKAKTEFEMLGAGTLIKFNDSILKTVNMVDYNKITTEGLNSFMDSCVEVLSNIVLREQQIYNFAEGDTVVFTMSDEALNSNAKVTLPIFETGKYTTIDDFTLSYMSGDTIESLPDIAVTQKDAKWTGTARLNINCSYDEEQLIPKNTTNSIKEIRMQGTTVTPTDEDIYMLSSIMLNKVGGIDIDVTYVDSYGNRNNPYIFIFSKQEMDDEVFTKNGDGTVTVNLYKATGTSIDISTVHLYEDYKILLPVRNISEDITFSLYNSQTEGSLRSINGNNVEFGFGVHYIEIPEGAQDSIDIRLSYVNNSGKTLQISDQIIFENIFKYTENPLFSNKYNIDNESILNRIQHYDTDGVFDYTHTVGSDVLIEDPLEPNSFFSTSHIFNKFTLPMADLYMSDSSQANITLVNNR